MGSIETVSYRPTCTDVAVGNFRPLISYTIRYYSSHCVAHIVKVSRQAGHNLHILFDQSPRREYAQTLTNGACACAHGCL